MIALFTDFGLDGPYTGQVKAVLADMAPGVPVVDLFADAPAGDPKASAYLLATYATLSSAKANGPEWRMRLTAPRLQDGSAPA